MGSHQDAENRSSKDTNVVLPGLGLIVSGKLFENLRNLNVTTEGNEVHIKLEQNLTDLLPPVSATNQAR